MRRKIQNSNDFIKYQYLIHAETIKSLFPTVTQIKIELKHFDSDTNQLLRNETIYKLPEMKFLFDLNCLNRECVDGGHDFTREIRNAVNEGKHEVVGNSMCNGWQDRERIGRHRCLMKVEYKVSITYSI